MQSYEDARREWQQKAYNDVREWISSEKNITCFRTGNAFYRQYMLEELDKFPYILKEQTDMGAWIYARKTVPEKRSCVTLKYPTCNISAELEAMIKSFESTISYELKKNNWDNYIAEKYKVGEVKPTPTRYIIYVFELRLDPFMERMREEGYEVSFFPLHMRSKYVEPGYRPAYSVPVYVNVPSDIIERLKYLAMNPR